MCGATRVFLHLSATALRVKKHWTAWRYYLNHTYIYIYINNYIVPAPSCTVYSLPYSGTWYADCLDMWMKVVISAYWKKKKTGKRWSLPTQSERLS